MEFFESNQGGHRAYKYPINLPTEIECVKTYH